MRKALAADNASPAKGRMLNLQLQRLGKAYPLHQPALCFLEMRMVDYLVDWKSVDSAPRVGTRMATNAPGSGTSG